MSKLQLIFVSFYIIAYFEIISTPKSHTLAPKKQLCHFKTEKDASHISMTHAFFYSYFKNLYFLSYNSYNFPHSRLPHFIRLFIFKEILCYIIHFLFRNFYFSHIFSPFTYFRHLIEASVLKQYCSFNLLGSNCLIPGKPVKQALVNCFVNQDFVNVTNIPRASVKRMPVWCL